MPVVGPADTCEKSDTWQAVWMSPPRSVYVHVPFCAQRCGYCNFALITGREDLVDRYLDAIEIELRLQVAPYISHNHGMIEVDTVFLGGGTPSYLSLTQMDRLFDLLGRYFRFASSLQGEAFECTAEANPNDLSPEKVRHFVDRGVNRFSLGAQSFAPQKLAKLERTHGGDEIRSAGASVKDAGAALALDLIFAAPGESPHDWQNDLQAAIACQPDHISTYQLTYEKGTQFWNRLQRNLLSETEDEHALTMYVSAIETLSAAGFEHYEVSNFCRPGKACRHNIVYWTGRSYFAFGPGAARYLNGRRVVNHSSTTTYIKRLVNYELASAVGDGVAESLAAEALDAEALAAEALATDVEACDHEMRAREYFVFGMRMRCGIDRTTFQQETGYRLNDLFGSAIEKHLAAGHLFWNQQRLQVTGTGLNISDAMWPDFL